MSRLVAVSNRISIPRKGTAPGGLAVGVLAAMHARGGLWFGWSGRTTAAHKTRLRIEKAAGITCATLDLTQPEHDGFYNGFSNNCLWPLLHFRIDLMRFERAELDTYRHVNARFAAGLARVLKPDDLVWAHDFHLIPLAEELRRLGVRQRIGFFLHTPFPPTEILSTLPVHEGIMRALFEYDLVGFQTGEDLARFEEHARRTCAATVKGDRIILQPHPLSPAQPRVARFPQDAEVIGQVVGVAMRLGDVSFDDAPRSSSRPKLN